VWGRDTDSEWDVDVTDSYWDDGGRAEGGGGGYGGRDEVFVATPRGEALAGMW